MKRNLIILISSTMILILTMFTASSACVHDSQAQNNGTCYADAVLNPDGSYTINSYNCETPRPRDGYPPVHNCVRGEGDNNPGGDDDLPQIIPGL